MTLTLESLSWSRREKMNEPNAALEAEYAGTKGAGMIPRWDPVLYNCQINPSRALEAYKIMLVSPGLCIKKGKKFTVMSTTEVKLVATSEWKAERSKSAGSASFNGF